MIDVIETPLSGVLLIEPRVFEDERGFFMETFNADDFANAGLPVTFVQDNHSRSSQNVLRGLHYQYPQWQGKLVRTILGEIFDVAVDIRRDSPTFGEWYGATLTDTNKQQLYIPPGFAHGFCVMSEFADVVYKCTTLYKPSDDAAVRWNDPEVGIDWPIENPLVSPKDAAAQTLQDVVVS